jgi:glycosyltransferase involved in cell wall biosynthesis
VIVTFQWPTTHHRAGGVVALYEFANGLARRGHEVHFVHGPAWPDLISSADELWHPFEPSVVHHVVQRLDDPSLPEADVVFCLSAPARLGQPAVVMQGFRMLPLEMERTAFRTPGLKVCVARWLLDVGAGFGVPAEQLHYVPMGMDHELFSVRTPADDRPYDVALWCNPHPTKGWLLGLEAIEQARRRVPDLRTIVFAAAPPDPPLDLGEGYDLVVGLDQRRLADEVFNASRVFVQSSFREGFGYTAVEAMACGAALVTTDNGGSRDYAVAGETALVTAPGDVEAMAECLVMLLTDHAERRRIAHAGERYVRRFDWDVGAELLEEVLLRYLDDPAALQQEPADDADLVMVW